MSFEPDPYDERGAPASKGDRVFLVVFCVLLFGAFAADLARDFGPTKLSVVFFLLAWGPMLFLHEAGHAVAARALGWRVHRVVLGFGPLLWRGEVGGARVEVNAFPLMGFVQPTPPADLKGARWRSAAIAFAGPGVELAFIGVLALWLGPALTAPTESVPLIALQAAALAAAVGAITNLLPFRGPGGVMSDGMAVLTAPLLHRDALEARAAGRYLLEAEVRAEADDLLGALERLDAGSAAHPAATVALQLAAAPLLVKLGRRGEALMRLQGLAQDPGLPAHERRAVEALRRALRAD
jgi:hypothetical protein